MIENKIYIVFRGSESKYDWYYNFHIKKKKLNNNIYVHLGYYNVLMADNTYHIIKEIIIELIRKKNNAKHDFEICLTGHSAGSSVSSLCTFLLSKELPNYKFSNYTFGCPRIGNYDFIESFESSNCICWNIVNNKDIVSRIPSIGYYNMKNIIYLDTKSKTAKFKNNKPNKNWLYNILNNLFDLLYNFSIFDHKMSSYITNLNKFYL